MKNYIAIALCCIVVCEITTKEEPIKSKGEKQKTLQSSISKAQGQLSKQNFTFIPGDTVRELLIHFGANPNEMKLVNEGKIHSILEQDYAMYFRQSAIQRNLLIENEVSKNGRTKRIVKDSGVRSVQRFYDDEIASSYQDGAEVAVKRSGDRNHWPTPPNNYVGGTVSTAISRMMEVFMPDTFSGLPMTNTNSNVTIQDQILIRINKKTDNVESPTPEGCHQDGQQIVAVTLTGFLNLESGGETRVWPLSTPKGNYKDGDFDDEKSPFYKKNSLFNCALRNHWDTIIFDDRDVRHEVRPFDGKRPAYRDVIVSQLRKPYADGIDKMLNEDGHVVAIA